MNYWQGESIVEKCMVADAKLQDVLQYQKGCFLLEKNFIFIHT
jgi:hypothetical protein